MTDSILKNFELLAKSILKGATTFSFETRNLPDINDFQTDIRNDFHFSEIFKSLDEMKNNCLYWFSLKSNDSCSELNKILNSKRGILVEQGRLIPVVNTNSDSNVLYVGIRRGGIRKYDNLTNISGRIIQHLGYYHKGSTQGLQLVHWTKNLNYEIKLSVIEFENLPNAYLNIIEQIVAHELKPLCGKH